ncbi:Transmembrane protein 150C [Larimichthys crocea]|uniref:Uncharacterized protein n=1 Tax=Larimichthys crocea TaxID=215358 RepID=A0ACD3QNF0_LARCR|nr:Transmembrane protein 150C [Larimichthys crocea]
MLNFSPWALLPPVYSAGTAAGLWLVYFMAVSDEKVVPLSSTSWRRNGSFYPPYISIAGNYPPASCIFSEVMTVAAFLGFIVAVLRYLQLKPRIHKAWLNVGSLLAFSAACFGMTLVGNFQLFNDEIIHNFGTFMTFGLGTLFCWVQSYITLRVDIKNEGRKAGVLRFLLSGSITLCMILYFSLMGQGSHMHASRCQWALVMFFLIFISTFAIEFRHSRFNAACTDGAAGPLNVNEAFSEVTRYQPDQM